MKIRKNGKGFAFKLLLCAAALILTVVAAMYDLIWLCAPSIAIVGAAVMIDE